MSSDLIVACKELRYYSTALEVWHAMRSSQITPTMKALYSMIAICTEVGSPHALQAGQHVHTLLWKLVKTRDAKLYTTIMSIFNQHVIIFVS